MEIHIALHNNLFTPIQLNRCVLLCIISIIFSKDSSCEHVVDLAAGSLAAHYKNQHVAGLGTQGDIPTFNCGGSSEISYILTEHIGVARMPR